MQRLHGPIGLALTYAGYAICTLAGIVGFLESLIVIDHALGYWAVVIACFTFPITLVGSPWYVLIFHGSWVPLALIYGGAILGRVVYAVGLPLSIDWQYRRILSKQPGDLSLEELPSERRTDERGLGI